MRFLFKKISAKSGQRKPHRVRIQVHEGRFQIDGMNAWYSYWRDPYHLMLTIPWFGFLGFIILSYVGINAFFALLYLLGGDCIGNARFGGFWDDFFFSVQTLASIGYGVMYPKTFYANVIVTSEAITGLVGIAVFTGLAFARFSRPTARVIFSRVAVVAPHEGVPTLIFRAANKRRNQILEAQMRVHLMRDETTFEGQFIRRIYDLKLLRQQTPSFTLSWLVMHPVDEFSPLYGFTLEDLINSNSSIVASLSGLDETVAQVVYARNVYAASDILWNNQFVDIFYHTPDGHRYLDYSYFHEVLPIK